MKNKVIISTAVEAFDIRLE